MGAVMVAITLSILTPSAGRLVPGNSAFTHVFILLAVLEFVGLFVVGSQLVPSRVAHQARP